MKLKIIVGVSTTASVTEVEIDDCGTVTVATRPRGTRGKMCLA